MSVNIQIDKGVIILIFSNFDVNFDPAVTNGHNVKQTLSREEMASWRRLVRKNPENFKRMCEDIGMAPDIWSLYEWSNWLTPTKLNVQ